MKLFIVAALISAVSAARLEHLERGYLPPTQNNYAANGGSSGFPSVGAHGTFGFGNQGSQYNAAGRSSNGFGNNGVGSIGFGTNGGHGSNGGLGSNGFGANGGRGSYGLGANGAGSNNYDGSGNFGRNGGSSGSVSNQYLPPNFRTIGGHGTFESIKPSCTTCGSSNFGSSSRYPQQSSNFVSQSHGIPSTQYGSPQSLIPSSTFGSQSSYSAQQNEATGASRQYLAPKISTAQNGNQQPFDENTGYIY